MDIKVNSNYNYSYQFIKAYFEELFAKVETLQPKLTVGDNISINDGVISATDTKYTPGDGIEISEQNVISTEEDLTPLHYIEYNTNDEIIQTSKPIVETVTGYSLGTTYETDGVDLNFLSVAKNGNKLTIAYMGSVTTPAENIPYSQNLFKINIPQDVYNKLVANFADALLTMQYNVFYTDGLITVNMRVPIKKVLNEYALLFYAYGYSTLSASTKYNFRGEITFLLSDNLVPQA